MVMVDAPSKESATSVSSTRVTLGPDGVSAEGVASEVSQDRVTVSAAPAAIATVFSAAVSRLALGGDVQKRYLGVGVGCPQILDGHLHVHGGPLDCRCAGNLNGGDGNGIRRWG